MKEKEENKVIYCIFYDYGFLEWGLIAVFDDYDKMEKYLNQNYRKDIYDWYDIKIEKRELNNPKKEIIEL